jgi:hypothetical protein
VQYPVFELHGVVLDHTSIRAMSAKPCPIKEEKSLGFGFSWYVACRLLSANATVSDDLQQIYDDKNRQTIVLHCLALLTLSCNTTYYTIANLLTIDAQEKRKIV